MSIPYEEDSFTNAVSQMNQMIRDAYAKGLGDGWFDGYAAGYTDGENNDTFDVTQNPWRD